jgi:hypothetical protein
VRLATVRPCVPTGRSAGKMIRDAADQSCSGDSVTEPEDDGGWL